jgi:hypothetical protein
VKLKKKRLEIKNAVLAALIKRHVEGVSIVFPAKQKVIKEEKNQGFKKQNYYKNKDYRKNSFSDFSHGFDSSTFQLAQAIQQKGGNQ